MTSNNYIKMLHLYISEIMALTLSDSGMPDQDEVRAIQAKLYEAAITQTLTLDTLKTYKEYLDTDIKFVATPQCLADCESFENNFPLRRKRGQNVKEIVDKYCNLIKMGHCNNKNCLPHLQSKTYGISLIHCLMMSDRNLPLIAFLHESGCDMKKQTLARRCYPLVLAATENQIQIVEYFVRHFDQAEFQGCFLCTLAVATLHKEPSLEVMKILLSSKWNKFNLDFYIPTKRERILMHVLKKQSLSRLMKSKMLRLFLEAGANPDMQDQNGKPPLFYSISYKSPELLELFIEFGAKVDIYVKEGTSSSNQITPLLLAVEGNNYDLSRILLEAGANPNLCSKPLKNSPLCGAAAKGSVALVKLLIRYGADVTHANVNSCSVIMNAVSSGIVEKLEKLETLLYADAPHDMKDSEGNTPLMMTSIFGHGREIMKALLDHEVDCDVNNKNQYGDTPLHFAAFASDPVAVKLLIDYGAVADCLNDVGATPLWNAVYNNCTAVVRELLAADVRMEMCSVGRDGMASAIADSDHFYDEPRSPLYVALEKKNRDVVLLLKAAGYDIRKETWIQSEPMPHAELNAGLIIDWVESSRSPMSLEVLCKIKLRKNLASEPNRDIYSKVERLEIPQQLKNGLLLKDLS